MFLLYNVNKSEEIYLKSELF